MRSADVSSAAAWAVVVAAFVAGLVGSGVAGLFRLKAETNARREQRADWIRDRRVSDIREMQDAVEEHAGALGRMYVERGKSDRLGADATPEAEAAVYAAVEGNLRIHKLRNRVRDRVIDDSVSRMISAHAELGNRSTPRPRQRHVLYTDLDDILTSMQTRLGELLGQAEGAIKDP